MTERWRKKLGDLDKQGPSDDVFDLAKQGPRRGDDALPAMKTSSRVVTAAVAFAVFALAISVFVVPALRMRGPEASAGSSALSPVWPTQSTDVLDHLQAQADSGQADWATDPHDVAVRFGNEVMGWRMAFAGESMLGPGCSMPSVSTPSLSHITCLDPVTGECFAGCPSMGGVWALRSGSPPGSAEAGYRSFFLWPCDPRTCDYTDLEHSEELILYQPLQQGPGQIWAVLTVRSPHIQLPVVVGQQVRDGATISAAFSQSTEVVSRLTGYASCGVSRSTPADSSGGLDVALPTTAGCSNSEPGYVWAAEAAPASLPLKDPLDGGGSLASLSAVPVTMTFPDAGAETPPPNGGSDGIPTSPPTPSGQIVDWTTVKGSEGWSMDVPDSWQSERISATPVTGSGGSGQQFTGDGLTVDVFQGTAIVMAADDSSFPLDYDSLLTDQGNGMLTGMFRGDGSALSVRVTSDVGHVTSEQEAILRRMVGSISFVHMDPGDIIAHHLAIQDPVAQDQWMQLGGDTYIVKAVADGFVALGPVTCRENGELHTSWDPSQTCPDSVDLARWSADGKPGAGNAPGFQDDIPVHPVIRGWDGTLIADLNFG